jgi:DNA modification methylase
MKAKYCHEDEIGKYMISKGKKYYLKGGKKIEDVIEVPNMSSTSKERVGYSTQKPKELLEILIKQSSNEGDVVADFFMGSGTSMVVAKELFRNYIGCDINQRAVDITNKRLEEVGK